MKQPLPVALDYRQGPEQRRGVVYYTATIDVATEKGHNSGREVPHTLAAND